MLKGMLIETNGIASVIEYENKLEKLQDIVGGYIEYCLLDNCCEMICNEEGKIEGLPYNALATKLVNGLDYIVGDVLIVKCDDEGENISLDDKDIQDLFKKLTNID